MINYLKFLLILVVLGIQLSEGRPSEDLDAELDIMEKELDSMLTDEEVTDIGLFPRAHKKKVSKKTEPGKHKKSHSKAHHKTVTPTPTTTHAPEEKAVPQDGKEADDGTEHPETVTDPEGLVVIRKEDLEFLEGVAKGKNKESYKKMSDKIYKALETNYKRVNEQMKDNQLFKAYVKNAHNVSDAIGSAYNAMQNKSLSAFLHDWYKMEYKPKKGEIKEVEEAVKAEEAEATAPITEGTTKAPKKMHKKKRGKNGKGNVDEVKSHSAAEGDHGDGVDDHDHDDGEKAREVHEAAKKVGIQSYPKAHLLKDLVSEHHTEGVAHMDVDPTDSNISEAPAEESAA